MIFMCLSPPPPEFVPLAQIPFMNSFRFFSLFLFVLTTVSGHAQVYRFKASSYSVIEMQPNGKWGKWSEPVQSNVVITLDGKKDRIIIDSSEMQLFKIETYLEKVSNETDDIVSFDCRDNEGSLCTIQIVTRKKQNNRRQIYINYHDVKFVYNIYD